MAKPSVVLAAILACAALLLGCAVSTTVAVSEAPEATPVPTLAPTPTPTPTFVPTPTPAPTPFSIAWVSDTQEYAANNVDAYCSMTKWIADTREARATALYIHTGDAVGGSYRTYQWENMLQANALLPADLPKITVAGNHDIIRYEPSYKPFIAYRPDTDFDESRAFGEGFTYYMTLTAGGVKLLVISLCYGEEVEAADWINEVCKTYSDHYGILALHAYMNKMGSGSARDYLFKPVIARCPNLKLVLCGHEHGVGYRADNLDDDGDGVSERTVHQLLFNLQDYAATETGFVRMLRFDPDADTIQVETYSPYLDQYGCRYDPFGASHTLPHAGMGDYRTKP